jgi:hypothetical protein
LETVEWALPAALRVFAAGDRFVQFEPDGPEDEGEAEQQTDIASHYLLKENNGFLTLHHWLKDTLMYPNGYVKLFVEQAQKTRVEHYQGLSAMGLQQVLVTLAMKGDAEVIEQDVTEREVMGPQGPEVVEEYEIRIRVTWDDTAFKWLPVPPDELLIDNDCTSIDLDEANFVAHRVKKSYTQLVNEGYDPDELNAVGEGDDHSYSDERVNRLFYEDENPDAEDEEDDSMRSFWVHECYTHLDVDGDGLAEYRRIVMIGASIFENEETDYMPFVAASAIPVPHKHAGLSYIDIVKDIQEIKSTLWRQMLDNIYRINTRRKYVGDNFISDEGGTLDILLDTMSEFIPARDPTAIQEEMVQPIVGDILPVIQGMNDLQGVRTGITPDLNLDPNVLQQSTEGAFQTALDKASERLELFVRTFAETGMRTVMKKMHQLLREYVDQPKAIKIRGKWVEFNPTNWHERENVTANVGLGFQKKEAKLGLQFQMLNLQKEAIPANLSDVSKIYNNLEEMVQSAGLGHAQRYFNDPTAPVWQPPQPQPDPMVELANRDMNIKEKGQQQSFMMDQAKLKQDYEEMLLRYGDMQARMVELEAKISRERAGTELTEAQTVKTLHEAQAQSIENSDVVRGVQEVIGRTEAPN